MGQALHRCLLHMSLVLTVTLWSRYYYQLHFITEREHGEVKELAQGVAAGQWSGQN